MCKVSTNCLSLPSYSFPALLLLLWVAHMIILRYVTVSQAICVGWDSVVSKAHPSQQDEDKSFRMSVFTYNDYTHQATSWQVCECFTSWKHNEKWHCTIHLALLLTNTYIHVQYSTLGLPEQATGWLPLRFGIGSVRYKPTELSWTCTCTCTYIMFDSIVREVIVRESEIRRSVLHGYLPISSSVHLLYSTCTFV